jgi:hypothetical protein
MFKKIQGLVAGGKKAFEFVKPKPKVNKTRLDKAKSNLNIALQKTKATGAKLKQTKFEIENPKFKGKDFTFAKSNKKSETNKEAYKRIQKQNTKVFKNMIDDAFKKGKDLEKKAKGGRVGKMGGGMMGRRMGYMAGSKKGKVPTTPKEKAFGMLSVKAKRDNNPNITLTDKIVGAKKRNV